MESIKCTQINEDFSVIIVLYKPEVQNLTNVLQLASRYRGVIVDNSETPSVSGLDTGRMHYVYNGKNLGIAEAQNIGIRWLMENTSTRYILFIDQDTVLNEDFVESMVSEYKKNAAMYPKLAILGPSLINKESEEKYESIVHKDKNIADGLIYRREIISSGSCVSTDVLAVVGLNDSSMFIDYVDFEWCWRAESKGFFCAVTPNVSIMHKVGSRELSFGRYKVILSSPFRYFYQYRNYLWLLRRSYVPMNWKINHGIKFFLRFIYFPLFVSTGFECWKNMRKGIKAGLTK